MAVEEGEVILDVSVHTIADNAFIENGVKSNIFTPKTVAYTTIRYSVLKSTAVLCTLARDVTRDHEYL